jgi:hypothetical protein
MDFMFPPLQVFPEFALHFSSPDYENLPDFMFCTSVLRISYSRQWTSFPVSSQKQFSLKYDKVADAQLQVIRMHHLTFLRAIVHEGIFP